jgi:hypothetical protein
MFTIELYIAGDRGTCIILNPITKTISYMTEENNNPIFTFGAFWYCWRQSDIQSGFN